MAQSLCSITGPYTTAAPGARLAGAKNVGRREVVPRTTLADLDDISLELSIFQGHFIEFWAPFYPPFVLPEFVAVDVGDVGELGRSANGADPLGRLSVELRSSQQIGVGVAYVGDRGAACQHRLQGRPPGERIVHNRAHRAHARQGTTEGRACRVRKFRRSLAWPDIPGTCVVFDWNISWRCIEAIHRTDTSERDMAADPGQRRVRDRRIGRSVEGRGGEG